MTKHSRTPASPTSATSVGHLSFPSRIRDTLRKLRNATPDSKQPITTPDADILPLLSDLRHSLALLPPDHSHSSPILTTLLPLLQPQPSSLTIAHHVLAVLAHHQIKPVDNLDIENPIVHTLHLYPFSAAFAHTAFSALQNLARPTYQGGQGKKVCQAVVATMERHYTHQKVVLRAVDLLAYHLHSGLVLNGGNGKSGSGSHGDMPDKSMCLTAVLRAERKLVATREGVSAVLLTIAPTIAGGSLNRLTQQVASAIVECMTTHIAQPSVQILGTEAIAAALTPAAGYASSLFSPEIRSGGGEISDGSAAGSGLFGGRRRKHHKENGAHSRENGSGRRNVNDGSAVVSDIDPATGSSPPSTASKLSASSAISSQFHPMRLSSSTVSLSLSSRTMANATRNSSSSYKKQANILLRSECLDALTGTLFAHQADPSVVMAALRALRCIATAAGVNTIRSILATDVLRRCADAVELAIRSGGGVGDEQVRKNALEVRELLRGLHVKTDKAEGGGIFRKGWMKMFGSRNSDEVRRSNSTAGFPHGIHSPHTDPRAYHQPQYVRAMRSGRNAGREDPSVSKNSRSGKTPKRKGGGWSLKRGRRAKKGTDTPTVLEPDWNDVDGLPTSPMPEEEERGTPDVQYFDPFSQQRPVHSPGYGYDSPAPNVSRTRSDHQGYGRVPRNIVSTTSRTSRSRETTSIPQNRPRMSLQY